ncbi:MAG: hypothetical protein E7665_11240 [Ruminococcaceae bacterium]|nr:hypothetical protein [Oscillospiraceae bacterium]
MKTAKKKKLKWQQYIGMAFMMLIGAVCGFLMVMFVDRFSEDTPIHVEVLSLIGLFIGMYVSIFFHLILHEAGHLVFGLMTGYRFSSFRILSFMWVKENDKIKLRRLSLAGTGGQCLMTPPEFNDGKFPFALYNLGGSIINTIIGALFLIAYILFSDVPFLSPLLLIFAIVGFLIAMMNGIPMRMGTVDNDGYNAFALKNNREAAESFWLQLKVVEQSSKGVRLKDMPSEWFRVPSDEGMKNSMTAVRGVFACNRLMDAEKFDEADRLMEHMLTIDSGMVDLHRNLLICDRIYIELIGENRSEVIETMLTKEQKKFMLAMKRFPSVIRTEYAIALLHDKDSSKAEGILTEFEKQSRSYPYPHEVDSERDLIKIARNKTND